MPSQFIDPITLARFGMWLPYIIGVVAAAMILFLGRVVLRWNAKRQLANEPATNDQGEPFVASQSVEMRSWNRRGGNAIAVFVADPHKTEEPQRGWVVDRSAGGICVALEKEIPLETLLRTRVCNAPVTTPWVELEVRSCRRDGHHWEIGCQFVTTPSFNVMMLFG